MPNRVYNRLSARGRPEALDAFAGTIERLLDEQASDVIVAGDAAAGCLRFSFQTASVPPLAALAAAARAHPEVGLVHEYLEERGDRAGRTRSQAGAVVVHDELERRDFDWTV